jgi:hypothetical protein
MVQRPDIDVNGWYRPDGPQSSGAPRYYYDKRSTHLAEYLLLSACTKDWHICGPKPTVQRAVLPTGHTCLRFQVIQVPAGRVEDEILVKTVDFRAYNFVEEIFFRLDEHQRRK